MTRTRIWLWVAVNILLLPVRTASAQLSVLSDGNPAKHWQQTQLAILKQQLDDRAVRDELREELQAQRKWLAAWKPGGLTEEPLWEAPATISAPAQEPVIDPAGVARELRERLLGPQALPTIKDTKELQELLAQHPSDCGVRQLHLHWLDQEHYRKTYPREIADSALRLHGLLDQLESHEESVQLAKAYCLYRRTRALAYRELPDVVNKRPIEDPEKWEAELLGAYAQLIDQVGKGRSEFILIDIRMLRRDRFYGRALVQLSDHARHLPPQLFLKKRRDLLRELGWELPAQEAAEIYALAFPEAVKLEHETEVSPES